MTEITESETVREQLRLLARDLEAICLRLEGMAQVLPVSPEEQDEADSDKDPDFASEVRRVSQCVLIDSLRPAIADLHAASIYKETLSPLPAFDSGGPGADLADRDPLSGGMEEGARPLPCPD